ncbi:FecR family protein [Spirosoma oryzae]|uniref:FecR family protein n=1 Tax=Spirosoma oryzae TaxID=1469603 RepID=A0A2T0TF90_9BACT|nr:FecR domain-containing protein [Spirosoma oryzae]PRY44304.1 FecR family protein [Spirosoma oryzae]
MNYLSFEPEDFAADAFFIRWVREPDEETETYWQDWLQTYPYKVQDVALARQLVLLLATDTDADPSESAIRTMWQRIQDRKQSDPVIIEHPARRSWFLGISRVAAVVALLVLAAGGFYGWQRRMVTYETAYGESQRIKLPDGSFVDLNAHSILTMRANWPDGASREVWLDGEAFFTVSKKQQQGRPIKFTVHTSDLDINVKGTQFDVSTRKQQTKVVLSEGSIQLRLNERSGNQSLQMKPGDAVVFSKEKQRLAVDHLANPQASHSWISSRWTLDDTSLGEVATMIEETYGVPVSFADDALMKLTVTGIIPTNSLPDLLNTLESILFIKIDRQSNRLIVRAMP